MVETLLALVLALAAVGLLGGLAPLADLAGALCQQRSAQRAAANLRASWPGGRVPAERLVPAAAWAGLAPDDRRIWHADASGWGAWADAAAEDSPGAEGAGPPDGRSAGRGNDAAWGRSPAEENSTSPRYELVLVDGAEGQGPAEAAGGVWARAESAGPAWIVVSWPVSEGRGGWLERARRRRWSVAVNLVPR